MTWTLRPWRMSDAGALAALLQDGRVRRMLRDGLPYPYTEADARAFLAETLASNPEEVFAFAIAQEDIPVGSLGMFRQGNIHRRTAELGYYLGPDHWGQGIGTWAGGGSMGLCPDRSAANLCGTLRREPRLLPGAGESGVPVGGGLAAERSQGRTGAGYEDVRPVPGRK